MIDLMKPMYILRKTEGGTPFPCADKALRGAILPRHLDFKSSICKVLDVPLPTLTPRYL